MAQTKNLEKITLENVASMYNEMIEQRMEGTGWDDEIINALISQMKTELTDDIVFTEAGTYMIDDDYYKEIPETHPSYNLTRALLTLIQIRDCM